MYYNDNVVRTAFAEMLENLIKVFPEAHFIVQIIVEFLVTSGSTADFLSLWHSTVIH
jgi:hypothetical protein